MNAPDQDAGGDLWTSHRQANWPVLAAADVDWLVVWNVNLGAGGAAFSVSSHMGRCSFRPHAVEPEQAWFWISEAVTGFGGLEFDDSWGWSSWGRFERALQQSKPSWTDVGPAGGIINMMGLLSRGVPTNSGTVLVVEPEGLAIATELVTWAVETHGGAWCPALVGYRAGERPALSLQRGAAGKSGATVAAAEVVEEIVTVDGYGMDHPEVLLTGDRHSPHRAQTGTSGHALVPLPDWLQTRPQS